MMLGHDNNVHHISIGAPEHRMSSHRQKRNCLTKHYASAFEGRPTGRHFLLIHNTFSADVQASMVCFTSSAVCAMEM